MRQGEALECEKEQVPLEKAVGRICGSYVYLYPPGIPLLVPGERIDKEDLEQIAAWQAAGLEVHGLVQEMWIAVLQA